MHSRIYLGAHYFSDCMIGILSGFMLNGIFYYTYTSPSSIDFLRYSDDWMT